MTFFYDLNKKLKDVLDAPKSEHKQLNERDMSRAAKGYEKYGKQGMEALAKAGRDGKALDPVRKKYDKYDNTEVDEGAYQAGPDKSQIPAVNRPGNRMTLQDLDKERTQSPTSPEGLKRAQQQLGKEHPIKEKMNPAKQKSFAALAPPENKITFADKIAGAKKEVDEMLGDVAAEAMKQALGGGKQVVASEDDDKNPFTNYKKPRADKPKVGSVERGHKHDIEHTATGRKVTRRVDDQGMSVGSETDDEGNKLEKRGRGRPKGAPKAPERVTAKATKHKGGRKMTKEGAGPDDIAVLERLMDEAFAEGNNALGNAIQGVLEKMDSGEKQVDEKAVSKKQQKFMGMVHAAQKGEKPASKEVAKTAKGMGKKDAEDFAATKHKGLPEKAPKKKEKTEEAGGSGTPTASSGFSYGKGIYDSMNHDLEEMIAESMSRLDATLNESMSINMSNSTEGGKSLTITASDDDAVKLAELLKNAGLGGDSEDYRDGVYKPSCGDQEIDEVSMNEPDYPTNTETGNALEYSGGLNGPKSTGQSTLTGGGIPNLDADRQHSYAEAEEDALHRMMEMAGISAPGGASAGDYIDYVSASGEQPPEDLIMQNGVEYDPDTNVISVRNATSLANTHRAIAAAGWKKQAAGARPNPAAAGQAMQAGDTAYQLGEQDAIDRMMEMAGQSASGMGAQVGDYIDYVSPKGEQPPEDLIMQNGVEYDPDTNVISVRNATSLANTHRAIAAAGWKKQTAGARPNPTAAGQAQMVGDVPYQLGEEDELSRIREMAGIKEAKKPDANKDGIPDYAQDGKGSKDLGKAKDKEKKVDEGILASTANLWKTYKGQYGV